MERTKDLSYLAASNGHGNNQLLFTGFFIHNAHRIFASSTCIFTYSDATFGDQISVHGGP